MAERSIRRVFFSPVSRGGSVTNLSSPAARNLLHLAPEASANFLNTVFQSSALLDSCDSWFGDFPLFYSFCLLHDVKGLLRIHQMEASTTKPDLHTGLAQCFPSPSPSSLHRAHTPYTILPQPHEGRKKGKRGEDSFTFSATSPRPDSPPKTCSKCSID